MSVKSTSSIPGYDSVVRAGYLKKLKTYKKKFFVLRAEGPESSARLEYYDSEKKFNNGQPPKRSIPLKTCFNINKRVDTKYKHVIALYTKVDRFCIVLESEEELDAWLKGLLSLQHGEEAADGETPRPTFEHVWQVTILNRGLGGTSVIGAYNKGHESATFHLCLTDKVLSLIRKDKDTPQAELFLSSIRSCGSLKNYVYLEIGRSSVTGSGELWMETEDSNIAQNVHETIFHAMSSNSSSKEELAPKSRYRSSSATESSKPQGRKQPHGGSKHHSQDVNPQIIESPVPASTSATHIAGPTGGGRERCDSMPSRARTSSEGTHPIHTWIQSRSSFLTAHRPQSLYVRDISHSPPVESPISPPSAACSTDSAGSSLSIDDPDQWCEADTVLSRYSHSLTPDEAIAEENYDECPDSPCLQQGSSPGRYLPMAPISSDDGYVDMSPRGRHTTLSPAASFSSVTSGTPSTDMRFIDYPLEKVSAYFTPSEEESSLNDRPIRAYSVGSRPDNILNKTRMDTSSTLDNVRVRAFSVGSKSRKILTRVLPPHGNLIHPKPKSSSAPLLNSSRTLLNHNSDLMEMDFSKPTSSTSGYVDMTPKGYVDMTPGHKGNVDVASGYKGYLEMRPGLPQTPITIVSQPENPSMQSGPKIVSVKPPQHEYVDMNSSRYNKAFGSSPKYPSIDSAIEVSSDYMDMDYHHSPKPSTQEGYVEMSIGQHQRQSSLDNEDYTDMSMTNKKPNRKDNRSQPITIQTTSSTSSSTTQFPKGSSSISPVYSSLHIGRKYSMGTYIPISTSNNINTFSSLPRQRSRKNSRRDSKDSSSSSVTTPSSSSIQFPLSLNSPSSPLKPQSTLKTSESQPSGTIKVPQAVMNVKYNRSSGDYTSMDFAKPSDYANYSPSASKSGAESDYADCRIIKPKLEPTSKQEHGSDYALMRPRLDSGDYAVMRPGSETGNYSLMHPNSSAGDYAVMRPGSLDITKTASEFISSPTLTTQLSSMVLGRTGGDISAARCFIPISESRDVSMLPRPGDLAPSKSQEDSAYECMSPVAKISRPNSVNSDKRPNSTSSELGSSSSTLVDSRPASVNSDSIRPGSVSIEGQLHYASLDLAPTNEEDCNRSPRTTKPDTNNTSPTQTITEGGASGFTYAEIDFIKSDGFKHAKVKN